MGFFSSPFAINKLYADPDQHALAQLFIYAASGEARVSDILRYCTRKGWRPPEVGKRVTHSLSMVKAFRIDVYPEAKSISQSVLASFDPTLSNNDQLPARRQRPSLTIGAMD
jgi:hypothetical protein